MTEYFAKRSLNNVRFVNLETRPNFFVLCKKCRRSGTNSFISRASVVNFIVTSQYNITLSRRTNKLDVYLCVVEKLYSENFEEVQLYKMEQWLCCVEPDVKKLLSREVRFSFYSKKGRIPLTSFPVYSPSKRRSWDCKSKNRCRQITSIFAALHISCDIPISWHWHWLVQPQEQECLHRWIDDFANFCFSSRKQTSLLP